MDLNQVLSPGYLSSLKGLALLLAVAASAVVYLVLLVNDYAIAVDRQSLGEIYIRQYAALPLFVAITGTLARRYLHALRTTRELAESLTEAEERGGGDVR